MENRNKTYNRALLASVAFMTIALPVAAQKPINESSHRLSFKAGLTPVIGDEGKQQRRDSVVVSLEYSRPAWKGEFYAAAEWRDFVSHAYEATQFSPFEWDTAIYKDKTGYTRTGDRGYITAFTRRSGLAAGTPTLWPDMRFDSVDMRQNPLDGISAKIAYRHRTRSLPYIGSLGIQGGLTLSMLTGTQYADGAIHVLAFRDETQNALSTSTYPSAEVPIPESYGRLDSEFFTKTHKDSKVLPGAFIGVRKLMTDNLTFEVNLTMLGHTELNYVPLSYSGQAAHWESSNKNKILLEFIAGIRF